MKLCRDCRQILPLRFFHKRSHHADGHNSYCKPCACARSRAHRIAHLDEIREKKRAYHVRTRAERAAKWRRMREKPGAAEAHRARARTYYQAHKGVYIARAAAWNREHPEARREMLRRRRARIAGLPFEKVSYEAILEEHGAWCHICGDSIAPADLQFDHVIPLARGGAHIASNIRPAHGACNRWKATRLMDELDLRAGREVAAA